MDVIFTPCAGLDGPKKTVRACRITPDATGQQAEGVAALQECGTMTVDWLALSDGLTAAGSTHGARESPGASGKPGFKLVDGNVQVVLVTAAQVQQLPGRQTDQAAARGRANLRRDGLLHASVIPSPGQRELRALRRDRTKVGQERRREVQRGQGVLERGAARGVAETGIDLARFGTPARLAVWAGVAPGPEARAGQPRAGRTRPGHHPLRTVRSPRAPAAAHPQGTALAALSPRLAARRGQKRAMVAAAPSMVGRAFPRRSR